MKPNLCDLVDRYYVAAADIDAWFDEHIKPRLDACKSSDEVIALKREVSRSIQKGGDIRDLPGCLSVPFSLAWSRLMDAEGEYL